MKASVHLFDQCKKKIIMMKNKSTISKIGSAVSTIIFVVLIVLLVFAVFANLNKKENQISGIFGYSFAVVQSGSMLDAGFEVGDLVVIKETNTDTLKKDDIIVFYSYKDIADSVVLGSLTKITNQIDEGVYQDFFYDTSHLNRHTVEDAMNAGSMLVFHRVIDIYVDEYGTRFFETKGDSNSIADTTFIREDFVCAKYLNSSPFVQSVLQFVTSPAGLAIVVVVPVALTLIFQVASFFGEVKGAKIASSLLARKARLKDVDLSKIKLTDFLSDPEKVYLYDIAHPEDKLNLAIVLWEEGVDNALNVYQTNRQEYYDYFAQKMKKSQKQKLEFLKIKADLVHQNPQILEEDVDRQAKVIYKEQKEKNSHASNASQGSNGQKQ